jgi:hypothetical protein
LARSAPARPLEYPLLGDSDFEKKRRSPASSTVLHVNPKWMRTGRKPGVGDIDPVIDNERLYSLRPDNFGETTSISGPAVGLPRVSPL